MWSFVDEFSCFLLIFSLYLSAQVIITSLSLSHVSNFFLFFIKTLVLVIHIDLFVMIDVFSGEHKGCLQQIQ